MAAALMDFSWLLRQHIEDILRLRLRLRLRKNKLSNYVSIGSCGIDRNIIITIIYKFALATIYYYT